MNRADAPACDLLCISPHTDDAEIALGGTLAKLSGQGRRVWVCDLTRGELGTNGSPEQRWEEARAASSILGLAGRIQFEFPDGFIDPASRPQAEAVASVIRALRPRWIVAAPSPHRHPDHIAIPGLVRKAAFLARLASLDCRRPEPRLHPDDATLGGGDAPWIAEAVFEITTPGRRPSLYFDISDSRDRKAAALDCYASQFAQGDGRRETWINSPAFLQRIERVDAEWGERAGVAYAEALSTLGAPVLSDLAPQRWR